MTGRGWVDPQHPATAPVIALARELADPIRLTTLQLLATEGPHTATQLAAALGVAPPRLANHLARLRDAALVDVARDGRHAVYRLARAELGDVLTALSHYARADPSTSGTAVTADAAGTGRGEPELTPGRVARTCYDHSAGLLGVALFAALVDQGVVRPPDGSTDEVTLGPDLAVLRELGVEPEAVTEQRRKAATACLDRTERLPHLGGALGHAVLESFLHRGLLERVPDSRTLTVTAAGQRTLPRLVPGFDVARVTP